MYFAIEINDGQKCPYMLEEVSTFLDYHVVKVNDLDALRMNLVPYNPIPLTNDEGEAIWFAGIRTGRVKIPPNVWERFGRELKPEYEISLKGKIVYPITRQDEKNAVSLVKKILNRKLSIWLDNQYHFGADLKSLSIVDNKYSGAFEESKTMIEIMNVYFKMQKELYRESIEEEESAF